jgi:hypothetical protein
MAKKGFRLKGTQNVIKNLNKYAKRSEANSFKGLIQVAIVIRRSMEKEEPKVPVDTGNLRSSWFTNTNLTSQGPEMRIGFSANYAVKVHEAEGTKFRRPGSGPKFLEKALKRNEEVTLKILKNEFSK